MLRDFIFSGNQWLILAVLIVVFAVPTEIAFRMGRRRRSEADEATRSMISAVQAALLGLFGLLLAFTFSMAVDRYDARKQLAVKEANAIGTAYLRAGLLAEPHNRTIVELLRRYVDTRVTLFGPHDRALRLLPAYEDTLRLQNQLWDETEAVITKERSPITSLFAASLNEVIDVHEERVVARGNHVPEPVLVLVLLFAMVSGATIGYSSGMMIRRVNLQLYTYALTVVVLLMVVLDLDRPRRGLIQVSTTPMLDLRQSLAGASQAQLR